MADPLLMLGLFTCIGKVGVCGVNLECGVVRDSVMKEKAEKRKLKRRACARVTRHTTALKPKHYIYMSTKATLQFSARRAGDAGAHVAGFGEFHSCAPRAMRLSLALTHCTAKHNKNCVYVLEHIMN